MADPQHFRFPKLVTRAARGVQDPGFPLSQPFHALQGPAKVLQIRHGRRRPQIRLSLVPLLLQALLQVLDVLQQGLVLRPQRLLQGRRDRINVKHVQLGFHLLQDLARTMAWVEGKGNRQRMARCATGDWGRQGGRETLTL